MTWLCCCVGPAHLTPGYFRESLVGEQSLQIFPDFINVLCRGPQGTKGQKLLSGRGGEQREGKEKMRYNQESLWSHPLPGTPELLSAPFSQKAKHEGS